MILTVQLNSGLDHVILRDRLRPGTIVLNTSTIAPAEAAALAGQLGPAYIHAPVLGSVPAVTGGTLEILAGAGACLRHDERSPGSGEAPSR